MLTFPIFLHRNYMFFIDLLAVLYSLVSFSSKFVYRDNIGLKFVI